MHDVLEHLLLLAVVLQTVVLVRLLRRSNRRQRGYACLQTGGLGLVLFAGARHDDFLAVLGISMCLLTIVLPFLCEIAARYAFSAGRLTWAVRFTGLQVVLMPGSGLAVTHRVLTALTVLERDGAEAALVYLRHLAHTTEDPAELVLIHEHVVSTLFYEHRWDEAIAYYEDKLRLGHAATRPMLALGLLRAYGEACRLEPAAGLLRALETGPFANDPRAFELLGQARVTFLAYAGMAEAVEEALAGERRSRLGVSHASAALLRGIAWARAGQPTRAHDELQRVAGLARRSELRFVEASERALAHVDGTKLELTPELERYGQLVAVALRRRIALAFGERRITPVATVTLLATMAVAYFLYSLDQRGGIGMLAIGGLTRQLWDAGGWSRLFTAPLIQTDLMNLLLCGYAIWLGGLAVERVLGTSACFLLGLGPAIGGLACAVVFEDDPAAVLAGSNMVAVGLLVAGTMVIAVRTSIAMPGRVRRTLLVSFTVLLGLHVLLAAGAGGPAVRLLALAPTVSLAVTFALLWPRRRRLWLSRISMLIAAGLLMVVAVSFVHVGQEDVEAFLLQRVDRVRISDGIDLHVPVSFREVNEPFGSDLAVPVVSGLIDTLSLRAGRVVQLVTVPNTGSDDAALFSSESALGHAAVVQQDDRLPEVFSRTLATAGPFRATVLRQNGIAIARVVERKLELHDGNTTSVVLVMAPPEAIEDAPTLFATLLARARPHTE